MAKDDLDLFLRVGDSLDPALHDRLDVGQAGLHGVLVIRPGVERHRGPVDEEAILAHQAPDRAIPPVLQDHFQPRVGVPRRGHQLFLLVPGEIVELHRVHLPLRLALAPGRHGRRQIGRAEIAQDRVAHVLRDGLGHARPERELGLREVERVEEKETVVMAIISKLQDRARLDGWEVEHPGGLSIITDLEGDFFEDLICRDRNHRSVRLYGACPDVADARVFSRSDLHVPIALTALGQYFVAEVIVQHVHKVVGLPENFAVALVQEDDRIGLRILLNAFEGALLRGDVRPGLRGLLGVWCRGSERARARRHKSHGQDEVEKSRRAAVFPRAVDHGTFLSF